MKKFLKNNDGLVTIEWVGIAAVMVLAAIAITGFVMSGADSTSGKVDGVLAKAGGEIVGKGEIPDFGNGGSGS